MGGAGARAPRRKATGGRQGPCRALQHSLPSPIEPPRRPGYFWETPPRKCPQSGNATSAHPPPDADLRLFMKFRVRLGPGPTTPKSASSFSIPGNSFLLTSARSWRWRTAAPPGFRAQRVSMRAVGGARQPHDERPRPAGAAAAQPSGPALHHPSSTISFILRREPTSV